MLHRRAGQADQAEACWNRVLRLRPPERFRSVDAGIHGHLTRRNLAALAAGRGAWGEARAHWEAVLAECPGDPEASAALGRLLGLGPDPPPAGADPRRGGAAADTGWPARAGQPPQARGRRLLRRGVGSDNQVYVILC